MKRHAFTQPHFAQKYNTRCTESSFFRRSGAGFTLTETLIIGAVFGLFVLAGTLLLANERARVRDTQRIADMTRLSAGFALLYAQKASFVDAAVGCSSVGSNAASCSLTNVMTGLDTVKDPGKFSYVVTRVPDATDYTVQFRLERTYGTLAAGLHTISKTGVH